MDLLHSDVTEKIIGAAYAVHRELGAGFLEKVYENALAIELGKLGCSFRQQGPVNVHYEDQLIGEFFADVIVEDVVIVEIKAVSALAKAHEVQLVNYLRATGIEVGLLINFGPDLKFVRRVLSRV